MDRGPDEKTVDDHNVWALSTSRVDTVHMFTDLQLLRARYGTLYIQDRGLYTSQSNTAASAICTSRIVIGHVLCDFSLICAKTSSNSGRGDLYAPPGNLRSFYSRSLAGCSDFSQQGTHEAARMVLSYWASTVLPRTQSTAASRKCSKISPCFVDYISRTRMCWIPAFDIPAKRGM